MTSFVFRDRRLLLVQKALARLSHLAPGEAPPPNYRQAFSKALLIEEAQLRAGQYEVGDDFCKAVGGGWIRQNAAALINAANHDFALRSLLQATSLTAVMADKVKNLPAASDPDTAYFDRVVHEIGADQAADLAGIALGAWLQTDPSARINPYRDIAVMLPLRLETLFKRQTDGTWKLLLRVIPDEPSILRDENLVGKEEAGYLQKFWQRSKSFTIPSGTIPPDWLDTNAEAKLAWTELCDRIGAPRAAWMIAEFPPLTVNGKYVCTVPPDRIGDHPVARVSGLPPKLNVVAFDSAGTRLDIGSLSPSDGIPVKIENVKTAGNWLTDWNEAKKVGLGGEFALPAGFAPDTIAALYVHGLGDQEPLAHFTAHANAGVMGLLGLGVPTNAMEGAPTADLGKDPEVWRNVALNRMRGQAGGATASLANSVCGGALPDVPGVTFGGLDSHRLAQALWPALWGHYFRDIWGCGDKAHELWAWVNGYLWPEGPLPPLRIDAQPYGLLPVTSLEQWQRGGNAPEDAAEERIVQGLQQLVPQWARQAAGKGTVVDADESRLLDLLGRTGVSSNYDYRTFVDAALLADIYPGTPRFPNVALSQWKSAIDIVGNEPAKVYSAIWGAEPLELPLIGASRMPKIDLKDLFTQLYDAKLDGPFADRFFASDEKRGIIADSLLIRLMIWSAVVAKAWYMQSVPGATAGTSLLNPKTWDNSTTLTLVEARQANFVSAFASGAGNATVGILLKQQRGAIQFLTSLLAPRQGRAKDPYDPQQEVAALALPPDKQANLERALRATLDTASHRLDPWATGVAWHRLQQQSGSGRAHRRLGAYGWLDGPFFGRPGPNESGRLHAPSYDQALTSIILRDKYLSSKNELTAGGRNIWETKLNSASVRMALDIAQDIKMGFHVYEVIGRRVEEIVANGQAPIKALRAKVPLRAHRPDPRDVCNGLDALKALLGSTGIPGVLSNDATTRAGQIKRLQALEAGLAAFSDLLLAEGVYNVVGGHPEQAGDAMNSAAGFARPPDFGVVKTPPSGYRLTTNVVSAMPFRVPVAQGTPLELADASLAAFLMARFGKPGQWIFHARWKENGVDQARDVDLASLQLKPLDAVLIPPDFLVEIVRRRLKQPLAQVDQPAGHRLMRQVAGMFGVHPALSAELSAVPQKSFDVPVDDRIQKELFARYKAIHAAASTLAAPSAAGTDRASRIAFLRRALSWGIIGTADVIKRQSLIEVMFENSALSDQDLGGLVTAAQAVLLARLKDAPGPTDAKTVAMSAAEFARAIGNLVMPDGKLAITVRWSVADFRTRTGVRNPPDPALDIDWLPVVAVVRPPLARLEALQLEASTLGAFDALATWSSCEPGDPWRTKLVGANAGSRSTDTVKLDMSRMTNIYGAADAFNGTDVAVGGIDQFSEAVPMTNRTSYAAFGFNAPAARAPQAILLAVPAKIDMRLGGEECLQILIETRQLAHARAARIEEAGNPIAPTMWFQGAGPLRVRLDTGTQYTRS